MIMLVWFVAFMNGERPAIAHFSETTKFETEVKCDEFGLGMKERMADYARGALHLDWDTKFYVSFKCGVKGQPT